jgi:hypothetical protein
MKSLINQLKDHLQGNKYITQEAALEIINYYKDDPNIQTSLYNGPAYRALLFSTLPETKLTVSNDSCFSLSLEGISHYIKNQDLDYYQFIYLYKASLQNALIASSLVEDMSEEDLSDLYYRLSLEEELIATVVKNEELIFTGSVDDFFLKYP